MPGSELEQVDGAVAGAWIAPALRDGFGGYTKQQVPQIYEAYARILHPAWDDEGNEVTWAEVARRLGTRAHREMQWHAIVGSYDPFNFTDSRWSGGDPYTGELAEDKLDQLCLILARHTTTPESAFFGMSTIRSGVTDEWPYAAQLEQPAREWVVPKGPLAAVDQAPNLIWPEDRAWFVASEVDLDSTLVGGSRALIDELLAAPGLEVWEVEGEVSLQSDADKLNPVPEPPPGWGERKDPEVLTRNSFEDQLSWLSGEVVAVRTDGGVLEIEVGFGGRVWTLEAAHSTWDADDAAGLVGATIETVELDPESDALRLILTDRPAFEIVPLPWEDGDPPSWRVPPLVSPLGLKHGPGLFFEFPDEEE
ncbi:MAG TPA: hypothetical protein VJ204_18330 [Solirubrobacterales bacterium]|nr:hypothetical protein [Solirubrobacterales bacterium]